MANKFALVTGASSGIGKELAKVLATEGYDLVVASAGDRLGSAAEDIRALGAQVTECHADLATYEGVIELWRTVQATARPLDIACLNAGVGVGGLFAETPLDQEINIIRLNVEGTVHLAKHVVQHMLARREGRILITASIASEMVAPREAIYAASKAFDLSFAKSLRAELEGTGVTVTALQPGPTDTDFFHRAGMDNTKVGQEGKKDSEPSEVARQGYQALMRGDKHIYSASTSVKLEGAVASIVPDSILASMHAKQAKPIEK